MLTNDELAARLAAVEAERDAAVRKAEWVEHTRQTFEDQLNDKLIQLRERQADLARLTDERDAARGERDHYAHESQVFSCEADVVRRDLATAQAALAKYETPLVIHFDKRTVHRLGEGRCNVCPK